MKKILKIFLFCVALVFVFHVPASAQKTDPEAATKAAESILRNLAAGQVKQVWNSQTSNFFKKLTDENSFILGMSQRSGLGNLNTVSATSARHFTKDPQSGYEGDMYVVDFKNTYAAGTFLERVVVLNENGVYRMSGIHIAPTQ